MRRLVFVAALSMAAALLAAWAATPACAEAGACVLQDDQWTQTCVGNGECYVVGEDCTYIADPPGGPCPYDGQTYKDMNKIDVYHCEAGGSCMSTGDTAACGKRYYYNYAANCMFYQPSAWIYKIVQCAGQGCCGQSNIQEPIYYINW